MALEKKVYAPWAFTADEQEKRDINAAIYKELCEKYKIARHPMKYNAETKQMENINYDDYDIVLQRTAGYCHSVYKVLKNSTDLKTAELALICDSGDLCFGYCMQGGDIRVSED